PHSVVKVGMRISLVELGIYVQDFGIGISQKFLPRIFERFYRVDKDRSRKHGGTGLGLSIVKHIALAHKGRVEAHSELGVGSAFWIFIPLPTN
ncbi:MAG TPA: PAS domain-containing sensor histidine kinase, partial [Caldithrix sp.]|nr:PAS domain-containing sensor histidine kinase [Caldithrix sp.]